MEDLVKGYCSRQEFALEQCGDIVQSARFAEWVVEHQDQLPVRRAWESWQAELKSQRQVAAEQHVRDAEQYALEQGEARQDAENFVRWYLETWGDGTNSMYNHPKYDGYRQWRRAVDPYRVR